MPTKMSKRILSEAQKESNRVRAKKYYWDNRDVVLLKRKQQKIIHHIVISNEASSIVEYENIVYIPVKFNIMKLS